MAALALTHVIAIAAVVNLGLWRLRGQAAAAALALLTLTPACTKS
ncbi:hypothetical protein [Shewanella sp. SNU WT4]|nr:hypothetical protein [Shewanella sp. SNU WT4]